MKVNLSRDQARAVQETFFPYLTLKCQMRIRDTAGDDRMLAKLVHSIFQDIMQQFVRKLAGISNKLIFSFTDAEVIIFYQLLLATPVNKDQFWIDNLRNMMIDIFFLHICTPGEMPTGQMSEEISPGLAGR